MPRHEYTKVQLDEGYAHESLDRMFVVMDMFNSYVREHPFVAMTPELEEKADRLSSALYDMYNAISSEGMKYESDS